MLPKDYIEWMSERVHPEVVQRFAEGLKEPSPVSIRLNTARLTEGAEPEGMTAHVPWCDEGRYLASRPSFTADPLLHAGAYYVQEASSMFLAYVLRQLTNSSTHKLTNSPTHVLDLCAAPGGKSTLLRSLLPADSILIANEALPKRAEILAENMAKWGAKRTIVTNAYPHELANAITRLGGKGCFDLIVADVPCSGEGMFRKEPDAVEGWSVAAVERLADLQRSIISDIWPTLVPGGTLIYSTCTLNPLEDENNVDWIASELGADIIPIEVPADRGILGDLRQSSIPNGQCSIHQYSHLIPGYVQGEGFFLAVLRKHGAYDADETIQTLSKPKGKKEKHKAKGNAKPIPATDYGHPLLNAVAQSVRTLPTDLLETPEGTPTVDLSLADALRYLQRESIVLPPDAPLGIVQLCYKGQRLGPAKNLGNRANNLYPKEWRIRSQHLEAHSLF